MVSKVKLINGQKKLIPLTSDVGSGVPLGTLVAFSDDTPKDGYVQMGTTFDETKYPALYALLGSNQIPAMFDHSRPSEWKEILPYATHTISGTFPYTVTKDGIFSLVITTGENRIVTVNGVEVGRPSTQARNNITFSANKGDIIGVSGTGSPEFGFTAAYFEHPLFIKATSGLSENQQENVLNTLNNTLSYSTEEHATGRKWIDGKMIYNIAVEDTSNTSGSPTAISSSAYDILSTKNIERVISACWSRPPASGYNVYYVPVEIEITSSSIKKRGMSSASGYAGSYLILEYTKTT